MSTMNLRMNCLLRALLLIFLACGPYGPAWTRGEEPDDAPAAVPDQPDAPAAPPPVPAAPDAPAAPPVEPDAPEPAMPEPAEPKEPVEEPTLPSPVEPEAPVIEPDEEEETDVDVEPVEEEAAPKDDREVAYDKIELMTEVIMHIRKHYVTEQTYEEIVYGALHGMLQRMDPHSDFLEPAAYSDMQEDTAGKFGGIGIHIGISDGVLTVIAPIEDTPAYRAGLMGGDRIMKIEGKRTRGMSLREAVDKLRGVPGTEVTITIQPATGGAMRDATMVRDEIKVPSVKGTRILRDNIGYIRITQFAQPTAESLQAALEELVGQDMQGLVLDLRNNPGGLLTSAIEVSQKFLKKGRPIVSTRGRPGVHRETENEARGPHHYTDFPMAVLVNGGSASASEIVAGALQDNKRAVLVGQQTFGKGSVQSVVRLKPDGKSAIRLTTAYYYTPSGRLIHDVGIEPDIVVEVSPLEWRDVQLKRAREENPDFFVSEEEAPKSLEDVVDVPLQRALDILVAMRILMP